MQKNGINKPQPKKNATLCSLFAITQAIKEGSILIRQSYLNDKERRSREVIVPRGLIQSVPSIANAVCPIFDTQRFTACDTGCSTPRGFGVPTYRLPECFLQAQSLGEDDVVLDVDVLMQVLFELAYAVEQEAIRATGSFGSGKLLGQQGYATEAVALVLVFAHHHLDGHGY